MRIAVVSAILLTLLISACQPQTITDTDFVAPEARPIQDTLHGKDAIRSIFADNYVGQTTTVRIDRAYCSYRADINGQPTFCNDAPYPNHDFTLLVWGSDWSDYDGHCLLVSGYVSRYKGKPQIIAESRSQVSLCD